MPTLATYRTDPEDSGNGPSARNGFTVVELLICVALVLIVTTLAISPFNTGLEKRELSAGAEAFRELFRVTQAEAVARNQPLSVSMMNGGSADWCIGIATGTSPCNCQADQSNNPAACSVGDNLRVINSTYVSNPEILVDWVNDNAFYFEPVRGLVLDAQQHSSKEVVLTLALADSDMAIDVSLSAAGLSSLCSRSTSAITGIQPCL